MMCRTRTEGLTLSIVLVTTVILFSQILFTPSDRTPSVLSSFNVLMLGQGSMLDHHDILQTVVFRDHSDSVGPVNHTFVGISGNAAKPDLSGPYASLSHGAANLGHGIVAGVGDDTLAGRHGGNEGNFLANQPSKSDSFDFPSEKLLSSSHDSNLSSNIKGNNNSGFLSVQSFLAISSNRTLPMQQHNNLLNNGNETASHITHYISWHNFSTENTSNNLTNPPLKDFQVDIMKLSPEEIENILKEKRRAPSISISDLSIKLLNSTTSLNPVRPQWTSKVDRQIVEAVAQIKSAPSMTTHQELYIPAFRNISAFTRSYELMEQTLKVYIYREGEKPIFHQPRLKGIYASEGWFMKQMEESKHFRVKDPQKAHLFYLPFSSTKLRSIGSPGPGKKKLVKFLEGYVDLIAAKYPFWNRTHGADHFLAACHDWAPYMTRRYFAHSIRALCNADAARDFQLGKDVSLPTINMILTVNPRREIGGRPATRRPTLAFFAGSHHGYLRNILFELWENKDPDLRIYGPSFQGRKGTKAYIEQMKTSKYCLCPRGYEVHTPRVIESILYGCIPVIISDNFVPPFFEALNWEEFSVFIAEKDIVRLKEILISIPSRKYLALHTGVKKVQQHFVWHASPVKYDIFHMILHSIWSSRLNRIQME